jgi:hypothetical protein
MTKRLLVHIGIGKAGSTAIQQFLRKRVDLLNLYNIYYWGLHLESTGLPALYQWQSADQIPLFQALPDETALSELLVVLKQAIQHLPDDGIVIWSQESIYQRPTVYLQALQSLCAEGSVDISVVAFARDHLSYALSAYKQWGIRHKHYRGQVLGIAEWARKHKHILHYGLKLFHWHRVFGQELHLFNYNSCPNVVIPFLSLLPQDPRNALLACLDNEYPNRSPADSLLLVQALFNNQSSDPVSPGVFEALLHRFPGLRMPHPPLQGLGHFLPGHQDYVELLAELGGDIELVSTMLMQRGHAALSVESLAPACQMRGANDEISVLLSQLLTMILDQDSRIQRIEQVIFGDSGFDYLEREVNE